MTIDPQFLKDSTQLLAAMATLPSLEEMQVGRDRCAKSPTVVRIELITDIAPCGYALTYRGIDKDGFIIQQHIRMVLTKEYLVETVQGKVGVA